MNFHYHRGGSYRLVENELDWEIMTGVVKTQAARGLPVKMLSRKEILEREPYVAPDIFGAVE
jgi:L-2-hydroxyglutarate oxidase LhgO